MKEMLPRRVGRPTTDLTGQKIGRLSVLREAPRSQWHPKQGVVWICLCDCGNRVNVQGHHLREYHTTSCGCYRAEQQTFSLIDSNTGRGDDTRMRIMDAIEALGFCTAQELSLRLKMHVVGVNRHLRALKDENEVTLVRVPGVRRYFYFRKPSQARQGS